MAAAPKYKLYIATKNGKVTDIIKESGTKRITRTHYHVYSTLERLSQDEYEALISSKKFNLVTQNTSKLVRSTLIKMQEFFARDWFKEYTSPRKQADTVKHIQKCINLF